MIIEQLSTSHSVSESSTANAFQESNMKSITTEEYKRLYSCMVELNKAKRTIDKLNSKIEKQNSIIQKLQEKQSHISSVSE